jgi:hypothetical protein
MSEYKSAFITGANAVIKLNGVDVALATDVSYRIRVDHVTPRRLGQYEFDRAVPVKYEVSGTLSIIRYLGDVQDIIGEDSSHSIVTNVGNGIANYEPSSPVPTLPFGQSNLPPVARVDEAFVPGRLHHARTFDIVLYQKASTITGVRTGRAENLDTGRVTTTTTTEITTEKIPFARIRECRLVESQLRMNKKSPAIQVFSFIGRYADEDTFFAEGSGAGDSGNDRF